LRDNTSNIDISRICVRSEVDNVRGLLTMLILTLKSRFETLTKWLFCVTAA